MLNQVNSKNATSHVITTAPSLHSTCLQAGFIQQVEKHEKRREGKERVIPALTTANFPHQQEAHELSASEKMAKIKRHQVQRAVGLGLEWDGKIHPCFVTFPHGTRPCCEYSAIHQEEPGAKCASILPE